MYAPARPDKNKQTPATSSGVPMRPNGTPLRIESLFFSSVSFIILDWKGPHASVLTVMPSGPNREARTRERLGSVSTREKRRYDEATYWCSAALEDEYA